MRLMSRIKIFICLFFILLLLSVWEYGVQHDIHVPSFIAFYAFVFVWSFILHRYLFDWKPKVIDRYTDNVPPNDQPLSDRVIVLVVDGMRKDRFEQANAPFLKSLRANGTDFTQMETVYPARTEPINSYVKITDSHIRSIVQKEEQ